MTATSVVLRICVYTSVYDLDVDKNRYCVTINHLDVVIFLLIYSPR